MKRCSEVDSAFHSTRIFWGRHKKGDKQAVILANWEEAAADQDVPKRRSHQKGKGTNFILSFSPDAWIFSWKSASLPLKMLKFSGESYKCSKSNLALLWKKYSTIFMAHSSPLNSCSKLGFFPEALQTDKIITVQTSEISLCFCCIWSNSQSRQRGGTIEQL